MTHTCVLVDSGGDGYGGYELVLVPVVLAVADLEPWSLLLVGGSVQDTGRCPSQDNEIGCRAWTTTCACGIT